MEQLRNQQEEIQEAALGQGGGNGGPAFALAELFALNVGMGHILVAGGRVRIESHDPIGMRAAAQLLPIEPDLERPQTDAFEHDGLGRGADLVRLQIDVDFVELLIHGQKIAEDFRGRGQIHGLLGSFYSAGYVFQFAGQIPEAVGQVAGEDFRRPQPATLLCPLDLPFEPQNVLPRVFREVDRAGWAAASSHLFVDQHGRAERGLLSVVHGKLSKRNGHRDLPARWPGHSLAGRLGLRRRSWHLACGGAFDLGWREAYPVTLLEDLVGGDRLAVDADEVVLRLAVGDVLREELFHGGAGRGLDVVGEPRTVVVDVEDAQGSVSGSC